MMMGPKAMIRFFRFWSKLVCIGLLVIVCACSSADDAVTTSVLNDDEEQDELYTLEQDVHLQINEYRQSMGLAVLQWSETIADYCRTHSLEMAAGAVAFGHDGFDARIAGIGQTLSYESAAENVAYNNFPDPATTAVQGWLTSPRHLAHIQGDFSLTGIGAAQSDDGYTYFTQIFIRQ